MLTDGRATLSERADVLLQEDFRKLYALIEGNQYSSGAQNYLQSIWFKAHYLEAQKMRQKPLGAVDKYRIRKRVRPFSASGPFHSIFDLELFLYQ